MRCLVSRLRQSACLGAQAVLSYLNEPPRAVPDSIRSRKCSFCDSPALHDISLPALLMRSLWHAWRYPAAWRACVSRISSLCFGTCMTAHLWPLCSRASTCVPQSATGSRECPSETCGHDSREHRHRVSDTRKRCSSLQRSELWQSTQDTRCLLALRQLLSCYCSAYLGAR